MMRILEVCYSSVVGRHHSRIQTSHTILQCGQYYPTIHQDAHDYVKACDKFQREGGVSRKHELSLIMMIELFDVWGIYFMGLFVSFHPNKYILVGVDYESKWVETVVLPNNDGKSVTTFLKRNMFSRFGTPMAIISYGGPHLYNSLFKPLFEKYRVKHRVAMPYHP